MSLPTTENVLVDSDVIDIEPTRTMELADSGAMGTLRWDQPNAAAFAGGTLASLVGETDTLRRSHLLAASACLAAIFGLLAVWSFASPNPGTLTAEGSRYSLRVGLIVLRCLLATVVAGLLASEARLTPKRLRVVENVLFLGLTLALMASQYFVDLELMRSGTTYTPTILALIKDGVIQMLVLMMIYGTLIPNSTAVAAQERSWWQCSSVRSPSRFCSQCIPRAA